jgi:cytoskeletal protein CcmA (bactofilin family)
MCTLGRTVVVKGELRASEDVTIEGHMEGPVLCEPCAVVIAASGTLLGRVVAREITVFGRASGQLVATEVVDIRSEAHVSGQIVSPRIILNEGGEFNGRVEPQHLEAALRVARFEQRKRDVAAS